jgi:hypothetical protein
MTNTSNFGTIFRIRDDRQAKALTGCTLAMLRELLPVFGQLFNDGLMAHRPVRSDVKQRIVGGGKKGVLRTTEDKLVYVLLYLKAYPTYDVLSSIFDLDRGPACRRVHQLLPVLEASLGRKIVLPERKITSIEEFYQKFPEAKDVLVDGTERPVQKPKDAKKRKKVYSGKKKTTTRKHIVISNPKKRILVLGKSKTGRRHDWRIAERQQLLDQLPPEVTAWMDSGFIGADRVHSNSQICAKATKKHPLTKAQKQNNRVISSFRIPVEHANAGMKRMKAAADIWRNKTGGMDDHVMLIAAGLWNFYLEYTEQDQIDKQLRLLQTAG